MGTTNSKLKIAAGLIGTGVILLLLQHDQSEGGVSGISNLGNTCFLNAILQAFSSCDAFTHFLFKLKPVKKSSEDYDASIVIELSTHSPLNSRILANSMIPMKYFMSSTKASRR